MKKYKQGDKLEIEWIDTFGFNGWFDDEEIDEKTKQSLDNFTFHIGYLIKETKDYFIICAGMENRNKDFAPYNCPKWIPRGFIKSMKKLK